MSVFLTDTSFLRSCSLDRRPCRQRHAEQPGWGSKSLKSSRLAIDIVTAETSPVDRPPSMAAEVADKLRDLILLEKLPPGAPVPEREFASALGVSRTPLREAIRLLEHEGLIEFTKTRRSGRPAPARGLTPQSSCDLVSALRPAFKDASQDIVARLAEAGEQLELPAGCTLIREGDPATAVFVVLSGQLRAARARSTEANDLVELAAPGRGALFGEAATEVTRCTSTVWADEESRVCLCPPM